MNNIRINKNFLLPENLKFSLSLFKKPFCSKENKKFKRYETVIFKNKYFTKKFTNLKKNKKILIISGPARNGNHILISTLDGHPQIPYIPGEDVLLREFFSKAKDNEQKLLSKLRKLKNVDFIINMSGRYFNKWLKIENLKKSKKKIKIWSGLQKINKVSPVDYQEHLPNLNYQGYYQFLKKQLIKIKKSKDFLNFFLIYLQALNKLTQNKKKIKKIKYEYIYANSGLRRELFYLLNRSKNIICIAPIRKFETFYFSYAKSRYKTNKIKKFVLNDLWQHWKHKTIDYLLLKKKYPKQVIIVKFEDLIRNHKNTSKKLCKNLKIKYSNIMEKSTFIGKKVVGNSSFKKDKKYSGKFYNADFNKFPKKLLPKEYFEILKLVNKVAI